MIQYIIQPGDNLNRVADQFGITMAAIIAANAGLNPQLIFPGQIILIPVNAPVHQNFPWFWFLPNLFNQFPGNHRNDRGRRPGNQHDRDGRRR